MRCERVVESGAYVLGALAPAERTAFEAHLEGCTLCRDEVADLAGVPGLLGRLDASVVESLLAEGHHGLAQAGPAADRGAGPVGVTPSDPVGGPGAGPPAPGGVPGPAGRSSPVERLLAAARHRRRWRRRWTLGLVAAGAAAVLALAGVAIMGPVGQPPAGSGPVAATRSGTPGGPAPTPRLVAMRPVGAPGPVSAQVGLTGFAGGTRIDMNCDYGATEYGGRWTFRLYVYGRTGPAELAGSWTADPGADVRAAGTTRWAPQDIAKVELRRGDGTPLLVYTP